MAVKGWAERGGPTALRHSMRLAAGAADAVGARNNTASIAANFLNIISDIILFNSSIISIEIEHNVLRQGHNNRT
jgi:hypothetical protein